MIIKTYEFRKINLKSNKIFLLYGKNEGHKREIINNIREDINQFLSYQQEEIVNNPNLLFENIFSRSLFDEKKAIIIKRVDDKFLNIVDQIDQEKIQDSFVILIADNLEKKSKLRLKFEKEKNYVCMAFYQDNEQVLVKLASDFLKNKKISLSASMINLITKKCNGDREVLFNELNKIELYSKNGKVITEEIISKLINLVENHSITELVDNYLAKNNKKIIHILNENNFNNEDCIAITRMFLVKAKKLLNLTKEYERNNNMEQTISSARPPIFWKDKEITKQQIYKWNSENVKKLIYKLNSLELIIKKNINLSINLIIDFILSKNLKISN